MLEKTLAQKWKDEGFEKGEAQGFEKGIEQGKLTAQRQTLLRLLIFRFPMTEEEKEIYSLYFAQINDRDRLSQLVDHLLTASSLVEFERILLSYLPKEDKTPAPSQLEPSTSKW